MALHRPISLSFGLLLVLLNAVFGSTAVNPIFSSSASSALPPEFITADANLAFLEQAVMGGPGMVSVPASQWQAIKDFLAQPSSSLTTPTDAKLLLLTRHGQSTANVASSQTSELLVDAPLTEVGAKQALNLSRQVSANIGSGMPLDMVVCSPLTRAINTSLLAYGSVPSLAHTPFVSTEWCREVYGVETSSKRRPISTLRTLFPRVVFADQNFASDNDTLFRPDVYETLEEAGVRAVRFLRWLFSEQFHSAKAVAVVSHSTFSTALLRAVGHKSYSLANTEVLPIVIVRTRVVDNNSSDARPNSVDHHHKNHGRMTLLVVGGVVVLAVLLVSATVVEVMRLRSKSHKEEAKAQRGSAADSEQTGLMKAQAQAETQQAAKEERVAPLEVV